MRQNNYYQSTINKTQHAYHLMSYSFRTKKVTFYKTKTEFSIDDGATLEGCEKGVENKFWKRISYKEFLDLLNQNEKPVVVSFADKMHKDVEEEKRKENLSDSRYFVRGDCAPSPYYKFLECRPDTSVIAHISKTETYKSAYASNVIITNSCWEEITKSEALKLFDELPVVKAKTVIPPNDDVVYYDNATGFKDPTLFMSANIKTRETLMHTKENQKGESMTFSYSYEDCEKFVTDGHWKHITKEQAYGKFKPGLQIESSPTPDKKIQLPEINFFILVKKGALGTLYFKYIDTKNWSWVSTFDECTKFSTTFLHGEKFKQIKDNLIDPLLQKDKQKLHWIQMAATKVQETTYEAY